MERTDPAMDIYFGDPNNSMAILKHRLDYLKLFGEWMEFTYDSYDPPMMRKVFECSEHKDNT